MRAGGNLRDEKFAGFVGRSDRRHVSEAENRCQREGFPSPHSTTHAFDGSSITATLILLYAIESPKRLDRERRRAARALARCPHGRREPLYHRRAA